MNTPAWERLAAGLGLLLAVGLTGCGGGGGNSGGGAASTTTTTTTANTTTLTGTLQNASGAALSGDTVSYDGGVLTTTTSSAGAFSLTIPASDITGSDTLTFFNSAGGAIGSQSVTPAAGQTVTITATATAGSPPPIP